MVRPFVSLNKKIVTESKSVIEFDGFAALGHSLYALVCTSHCNSHSHCPDAHVQIKSMPNAESKNTSVSSHP